MRKYYIILLLTSFFWGNSAVLAQLHTNSDTADSVKTQKDRKAFKTFIPGLVGVTYGVMSLTDGPIKNLDHDIRNHRNRERPTFSSHADDYLRYAPFIALVGLEALGVEGKNNLKDRAGLVLTSGVVTYGSVILLKGVAGKTRPNNANDKSFPSGHAAIAFAGAEVINQEYGDISPWYSVAGYTLASATAVLRVYNNEHWFSDVVGGAGIGILSTKVAYLVYPALKDLIGGNKNTHVMIVPSYQNKATGLTLTGRF